MIYITHVARIPHAIFARALSLSLVNDLVAREREYTKKKARREKENDACGLEK